MTTLTALLTIRAMGLDGEGQMTSRQWEEHCTSTPGLAEAWETDTRNPTRERTMDEAQFRELVAKAAARYEALSPEEKRAHDEAQRASFVRGFAPCEHGRVDFETCPECRATTPTRRTP